MTDDLVKQLRDVAEATGPNHARQIALDAADRIEELEAKLAKAVKTLENLVRDWETDYHDIGTIEGRLEAIQDAAGSLKIRVKDFLYPKAINCIVPERMIDNVLGSFRKRVEIEGRIHYRRDGTPISIEAHVIDVLPEDNELPSADDVRGIMASA